MEEINKWEPCGNPACDMEVSDPDSEWSIWYGDQPRHAYCSLECMRADLDRVIQLAKTGDQR